MRSLLCVLVLLLELSVQAQQPGSETEATAWFILLNSGEERAKTKTMPADVVQKMQADHVANFGTQFNRGTLMAAGPLGDNGFIRGTVILSVVTPADVADCFKGDPFVQNKILDVEAHPWAVDILKFGSPIVPFQLARHTLCIVRKGKQWSATKSLLSTKALLELFPSLKSQQRLGELALAGAFTDAGNKLGALLFYSSNTAQIETDLAANPAVAQDRVELEFHPQFLGTGTLRNPAVDDSPPKPGKQILLFDDRSFQGWNGDIRATWRIHDGALVGGSLNETVPHNAFLCTTGAFSNFDLRLKVKLVGTGFLNGGIQFRSQRLDNPPYEMTGYQADMGEGYWGSLYDESRRNKTLAHTHAAVIRRILRPNDWNDYIVRCEGNHIRLWLNGVKTVDYTETDKDIPSDGLIGLQIHGGGKAEASYKDILLERLP